MCTFLRPSSALAQRGRSMQPFRPAGGFISAATYWWNSSALVDYLNFPRRLSFLSRQRIIRRSVSIEPPSSRHVVPADPKDGPILQAALAGGVDYLVTNDQHLLALDPYEGLRIVSLSGFQELLIAEGHLSPPSP